MENKRYVYIANVKNNKLNIKRINKGWNVYELLGLVEELKTDIILQIKSQMQKPDTITRKYIHDSTHGEIIVKEVKK